MQSAITYRRVAACAPSPFGRTARPRLRAPVGAVYWKASLSEWEAEGGALERSTRLVDVRAAAKTAARTTDDDVRENPWGAIGIGAAVGVLAGYLLARR